MSTFRGVGIRGRRQLSDSAATNVMERRRKASDSVQGASELCRLMEEVQSSEGRGEAGFRASAAGRNPVFQHPAAPDASGYFLSLASTVIFVAMPMRPRRVVSTFTFEPAAVARPAA